MGNWVKCTEVTGHEIFINLDNALWLREDNHGNTWVALVGAEKKPLVVSQGVKELTGQTPAPTKLSALSH